MKPVLMIMHAREIPECIDAFRLLKGIDKAWFRAHTEMQLERATSKYVRETDYTHYIIASDDLIPTQVGLDAVLKGIENHDIFTGFSNMHPGSHRVNLMLNGYSLGYRAAFWMYHAGSRLRPVKAGVTSVKTLFFPRMSDVPKGEFQTWFVGFSFTSMSRDMWLRFPFFSVHDRTGWGSDAIMSQRLDSNSVPAYSSSDAFFYHLASMRNFIVGRVLPELILESAK